MRRALHFIAVDLGVSVIVTSGLAAFWLLCVDAAPDDVAALTQKASRDQRASEYVESIMKGPQWPSHGQLIVAQVTVSEILNHAPDAADEALARHSMVWRAYAPLLAAYFIVALLIALFMQRLRRRRKD